MMMMMMMGEYVMDRWRIGTCGVGFFSPIILYNPR